ncbi:MAG: hypothetical protein QNJ47_05420 [Nostocaceae cyanobacterium]|nr:hypothetical protein [Nostocaceae cyanobacterium]
MNNFFDANSLIALCALVLTIITTLSGAILWYVNTEKKKYAAERDFKHLRRNIEQLAENVNFQTGELDKNFEELSRDILEIKIKLGLHDYRERPK